MTNETESIMSSEVPLSEHLDGMQETQMIQEENGNSFVASEQSSSQNLVLTIVVAICVILGIVLGIIFGKRAANK